ncbi:MAG: hypothetical protein BIFFINMI_00517 [Phycisphaerae bacterium]|nr:hypothetical protein [Phycisphaerae bacterium]
MKLELARRRIEPRDDLLAPGADEDCSSAQPFYNYCPVDSWRPAVNLYESATSYYVCVDVAGMAREEISVEVKKSILVISGTRRHPRPPWDTENLSIHLMEVDQGPFCRSVEIPSEVDVDSIRANYTSAGFLWIELPRQRR